MSKLKLSQTCNQTPKTLHSMLLFETKHWTRSKMTCTNRSRKGTKRDQMYLYMLFETKKQTKLNQEMQRALKANKQTKPHNSETN